MPFVLDFEGIWPRPTKRRKISPSTAMARTNRREASPPAEDERGERQPPGEAEQAEQRPSSRQEIRTSDREELIQCIKRGERPTWVPKPNLEALCAEADIQAEGISIKDTLSSRQGESITATNNGPTSPRLPTPPRDPIPRPPSALHSGDFYEPLHPNSQTGNPGNRTPPSKGIPFGLHHSSPPPWTLDAPAPRFLRMPSDSATMTASTLAAQRSRAPSLGSSLSSSFVMRTPTSPLVQATSSPGLDAVDDRGGRTILEDKTFRRRTLPPQSFASANFSPSDQGTSTPVPGMRREATAPFRTHQSRRSLTSFTYQPASSAQGVYQSRHRRLSHTSETSPRSRNSMVGSFEESILRGRMSTPPSKPLDFVAQIGVLGKGDCPANLKCPAHVSVPFPAVFYNYPSTSGLRSISDDSPSPYVGTVDLEHHLKPVAEPLRRKRRAEPIDPDAVMAQLTGPQNTSVGRALAKQEAQGTQELVEPPKVLLDGAYRVPQQGQLQVVIKNPNKTAVKLFLIPYSLEGMSPGAKTFVRQRSFSSGPIMENVLSEQPINDPLSNKQILRYLIHLKFCCLSRGKYYLYDNIRVVFANRVPEGKEKLRNEIQLPEPKYSPFVAGSRSRRQSVANSPTSSPASMSGQFDFMDSPDCESSDRGPNTFFASVPVPFHMGRSLPQATTVEPTATPAEVDRSDSSHGEADSMNSTSMQTHRPQSPEVYGFDRISTSQRGSPIPWSSTLDLAGRRSPSPALASVDGLLSKKLRELGRQNGHTSAGEANGGDQDI